MGIHADELTEDMLDAKILHDAGECNDYGCEWCRNEEELEKDCVDAMDIADGDFYEQATGKQIGNK